MYKHLRKYHNLEKESKAKAFHKAIRDLHRKKNPVKAPKPAPKSKKRVHQQEDEAATPVEEEVLSFNFQRDTNEGCIFYCSHCKKPFNHYEECNLHEKSHEKVKKLTCTHKCGKTFGRVRNKLQHEKHCGNRSGATPRNTNKDDDEDDELEFTERHSAFRGFAKSERLCFAPGIRKLHDRLGRAISEATDRVIALQRKDHSLKYNLSLRCHFYKPTDPDTTTDDPVVLNSESCTLLPSTDLKRQMEINYQNILHSIETYEKNGKFHSYIFFEAFSNSTNN